MFDPQNDDEVGDGEQKIIAVEMSQITRHYRIVSQNSLQGIWCPENAISGHSLKVRFKKYISFFVQLTKRFIITRKS